MEIADDKLDFEFYLNHESELKTIDVDFTIAFPRHGKDVTDQMDMKFREQWTVHGAVLSSGNNFFGDYDVDTYPFGRPAESSSW